MIRLKPPGAKAPGGFSVYAQQSPYPTPLLQTETRK